MLTEISEGSPCVNELVGLRISVADEYFILKGCMEHAFCKQAYHHSILSWSVFWYIYFIFLDGFPRGAPRFRGQLWSRLHAWENHNPPWMHFNTVNSSFLLSSSQSMFIQKSHMFGYLTFWLKERARLSMALLCEEWRPVEGRDIPCSSLWTGWVSKAMHNVHCAMNRAQFVPKLHWNRCPP